MAHTYDSNGVPGSRSNAATQNTHLADYSGATREARPVAAYLPPHPPEALMNKNYGDEETIPGQECSYGMFAYNYSLMPDEHGSERSQRVGCHNPVEEPGE